MTALERHRSPKGSRWKFWRLVLCFAVFGALLPFAFYGACFTPLFAFVSHHFDVLMIVCPIYFLSMAFDHMAPVERMKTVAFVMAPINAVLYFCLGLLVAGVRKFVRRNLSSHGVEESPTAKDAPTRPLL